MGKQTIEILVEGGKANAGPPLGSSLGPMGVNVAKVVEEINEKTKGFVGIKVPVKITINTDTKDFEISVGTPPVAALVKKELSIDKASSETGIKRAGDLSEEQIKNIAKAKFGSDSEGHVNQVKGTCRSMGVTIGQGELTEEEIRAAEEKPEEVEAAEAVEEEAEKPAEEAPKKEEKPEKPAKKRKIRKGKS